MGPQATYRAMQAAERRLVREAEKRRREYDRQVNERAKLSALEQARLEVQLFENQLDVLLSVHNECGETWDWVNIACSLPPPEPVRFSARETKAKLRACLMPAASRDESDPDLISSRKDDDQLFNAAKNEHAQAVARCDELKKLSRRILSGEHKAYTEALVDLNPFAELSNLGFAINFTVHTTKFAECSLKVNGKQAIPTETKSLTASGAVSTKPMSKSRFQEVYCDYICGCILRVAREIFALLPIDHLLVTATADRYIDVTEKIEIPVLSVFFPRGEFAALDFEHPHAYELIELFQHRGNFKSSRRSEAFQPITPFTAEDVWHKATSNRDLPTLSAELRRARYEVVAETRQINPAIEPPTQIAI